MKHEEIERLVYRILNTEDEEINCDQVAELIARYVELEVSGGDAPRVLPMVHQHLVQCDACSEMHDMLYELVLLEEQGALPDPDDLLDAITAGGPISAPEQPLAPLQATHARPLSQDSVEPPFSSRVHPDRDRETAAPAQPAPWFRWGWAAAAVALIIAIAFGVWGWRQASAMAAMKRDLTFIANADRAIWMQGTEGDPDVRGFMFINEDSQQGFLVIEGLNEPPSGQVYQMWTMTDSSPEISVGTFATGADERGRVWIDLNVAPGEFTGFAITLEPAGGSSEPTSSPVCVWGKKL